MIAFRQCVRLFFCSATDPLNLAVFRLAVFVWLLRLIARTDFLHFVQMPAALRVPPPGYESFFHRIPLEAAWVTVLQVLALLACASALVGFMTRTAAAVACVSATYLLLLPHLFGRIDHLSHHLIWFTAILAVAPSGDALSIDALRAAWRRADSGDTAPPPASIRYALPLRFVWLLIGVLYFFPGLWKLHAGPEWFLGDNIKYLMYQFWSEKGFLPAFRIDHYPLLCRLSGLGTIAFEVSFFACLFFPRLRLLAVTGGLLFHCMTFIYLCIVFFSLLLCYAAFIDWSCLGARIGRALYRRDLVLTYDVRDVGARRLIASVRAFDVFRVVRETSRHAEPATPVEVTIAGRALTGMRAVLAVALRVPLLVPLSPLLLIAYRAARRHRPEPFAVPATETPQRYAAIVAVGALLLAANIYCGVTRTVSWPFSVYPEFSSIIRTPTRTAVEVIVRGPHGEMRRVELGLHPQVLNRIRKEPSPRRDLRLRGVQDLLIANHLALQPGESLEFYEVTWSIIPEDRDRAPLHRELLWEYQPDAASGAGRPSGLTPKRRQNGTADGRR